MHILLLNDDAVPSARGGAAIIVDHLRHGFKKAGHTVTLITTHQNDTGESRMNDDVGTIISLPIRYDLRKRHYRCVRNPAISQRIKELFLELKPGVVHAHNVHTYLTYESLQHATLVTDRIFLTAHDTFLVSFDRVRGSRYEHAALKQKGWKMHWWNHLLSAGKKYAPLRNSGIKKILHSSGTKTIAISEATALFLRANDMDVHAVIPNGLAPSTSPTQESVNNFRQRMGLTGPTILFAGRMRVDKGLVALLRIMEHVLNDVPNVELLLVGEYEKIVPFLGSASPRVQKAVHMTGWITGEDLKAAYAVSDVVTTPSIYLDNFPTVNLEAMNANKAIVGTCFGGTNEAVVDGDTGFIRNPRNEVAFASALVTLLRNPELAQRMGSAGQKRVTEHFSLHKQVYSYLSLFGEKEFHPVQSRTL